MTTYFNQLTAPEQKAARLVADRLNLPIETVAAAIIHTDRCKNAPSPLVSPGGSGQICQEFRDAMSQGPQGETE